MATAAAILLGAGLSGLALYNSARARRALFPHGSGRFVGVAGVRLHLLEQGSGTPLILLHGNGSSAEDFKTSGMLDKAASRYRVLALTGPASAGARGREANGGRRPSKPISFMPPSRSLGPKDISFWAIPGARRWLSSSCAGTQHQLPESCLPQVITIRRRAWASHWRRCRPCLSPGMFSATPCCRCLCGSPRRLP